MPFQKFVEIGRVAFLADGPTTGVTRQAYRQKEMHLTPMKVNFPFNASTKVVRSQLATAKVAEKWAESTWSKRLQQKEVRANLTDFERFKLRKAKSQRNKILTAALNGKKALRKAGKL